jgi:hypothetical protein
VSIPADELFRMARENDFGTDEDSAAALLAAAVLRAEERREGAIDIDTVRRALFLLRGQQAAKG